MKGTDGYSENAKALAEQYESITFADVHRDVLSLFPVTPSRILDIGAGTGRDAAALSAKGHTVLAAEPTAELRNEGMLRHRGAAVEWVDDTLPDLAKVKLRDERYDLILLTAVWMHLDETERRIAMTALADLLAADGRVIMSLRHGPVPAGRKMFDVSATETIMLATSFGLRCVHSNHREDMLGRNEISWSFVAFDWGRD